VDDHILKLAQLVYGQMANGTTSTLEATA